MNPVHAEYSHIIEAQPEAIYAVLVDFHDAHVAILPKPYFANVTILEGGIGAGTRYDLEMDVFGLKRTYEMYVTEPKPGHILRETAVDGSVITEFNIEPINGGHHSRVTISSRYQTGGGMQGFMEKLTYPLITRHIYKKELQNLAQYLTQI